MKKQWLISVLAILCIIGLLFVLYGYENTWRLWNIPTFMPPFLDMQLITHTVESIEDGFDPAIENPRDPGQRIFNYPKVWYLFLSLGFGSGATIYLAVGSIIIFFVCLLALFSPKDHFTSIILTLVLFSPALMLGFERANVDLIFFALIATSLLLVDRYPLASLSVFLIGILGKIFPLFAAGIFFENKASKRSWLYPLLAFLVTIFYFAATWLDMLHIFQTTQKGTELSYGIYVLPDFLQRELGIYFPYLFVFFLVFSVIVAIIASIFGLVNSYHAPVINYREARFFLAGAGIFIGTFFLGNNWDYRLMFTLFCVPALSHWAQSHSKLRTPARIALISLLISCWYLVIDRLFGGGRGTYLLVFFMDEAANWLLFSLLTMFYIASLPKWITGRIHNGNPFSAA